MRSTVCEDGGLGQEWYPNRGGPIVSATAAAAARRTASGSQRSRILSENVVKVSLYRHARANL
jgi:hypothetical protein